MSKLKKPAGFFEQNQLTTQLTEELTKKSINQLTSKSINKPTDKLTSKSTDQLKSKPLNKLTSKSTGKSINRSTDRSTDKSTDGLTDELTSELTDIEDHDSEVFLSQLKRPEKDKKIVGFHLTGEVRRALKKLKADDYEMSEVVDQLLRKHLPKKYFE